VPSTGKPILPIPLSALYYTIFGAQVQSPGVRFISMVWLAAPPEKTLMPL